MCEISSGKSSLRMKNLQLPKVLAWHRVHQQRCLKSLRPLRRTECTYSDACHLFDLLGFISHQGSAHIKVLTELLNKSLSAIPSDMQKLEKRKALQFHRGKNNEIL